jgi:hypothetical protein
MFVNVTLQEVFHIYFTRPLPPVPSPNVTCHRNKGWRQHSVWLLWFLVLQYAKILLKKICVYCPKVHTGTYIIHYSIELIAFSAQYTLFNNCNFNLVYRYSLSVKFNSIYYSVTVTWCCSYSCFVLLKMGDSDARNM